MVTILMVIFDNGHSSKSNNYHLFSAMHLYERLSVRPVSQVVLVVKNLPANAGDIRDVGSNPGLDPLEKEMATASSILAWRIPWTEDPRGLQFIASQRVGGD